MTAACLPLPTLVVLQGRLPYEMAESDEIRWAPRWPRTAQSTSSGATPTCCVMPSPQHGGECMHHSACMLGILCAPSPQGPAGWA